MNEIDETNLTVQTKFRLNEISKKSILIQKLIKDNHVVKN